MNKEEIIKTFKSIIDKENDSFIIPSDVGIFSILQGVNFDICNSIPESTKKTYFKIDSVEQAKEIWTKVLSNFPPEKEVDKVFDKNVPNNLNIDAELFLSIYSGPR